jgi:hypothetical protein
LLKIAGRIVEQGDDFDDFGINQGQFIDFAGDMLDGFYGCH